MGPGCQEALGLWKLGWTLGTGVGAEATMTGGERRVGGAGGLWSGPVVRQDRAHVPGDRRGRLVGLVSQPVLCVPSGGEGKDHLHQLKVKREV